MNRLPLEDVTILDLSWMIAGPHATKMLQDMGAHVIKVESHRSMDLLRSNNFRCDNQDWSEEGGWHFQMLNSGRENISINLKSTYGREALEELIRKSDFVVCNYGTNAFKKLRLTYEELVKIKEDIIVVNASGMGFTGLYNTYATYAPNLQAVTGIAALVGFEGDREPYDDYPPLADYLGAIAVANHLLLALEYRRRTGKGQFIDLSQFEAAVTYMGTPILDHEANGTNHGLIGNHHFAGCMAPHNAYRCREAESYCVIVAGDEAEWQRLRKVIDPNNVWSGSEKFATLEKRVKNERELDAHIEEWTLKHTPQEVGELLQAAKVSGAPVQKQLEFLYEDKHIEARKFFQKVDLPVTEERPFTWKVCGNAYRFAELPRPDIVPRAHGVGEDTEHILKEYLGKSEEWIRAGCEEHAFE